MRVDDETHAVVISTEGADTADEATQHCVVQLSEVKRGSTLIALLLRGGDL